MNPEPEVVLPKSGLVLTSFDANVWKGPLSHIACSGAFFMVSFAGEHGPSDLSEYVADDGMRRVRGDAKARCIAWLDARVLETRAALMPADARDRVARALYELEPWQIKESKPSWEFIAGSEMTKRMRSNADAVLAALGLGKETTDV